MFETKTQKILELELRKNIYFLVKKHSGCHLRELVRLSKLPLGTLKHHLDFLTRHGLIKREKQNSNLRYFFIPLESENLNLLGLLRQKTLRDILLYLVQNKKANNKALSSFTNLSPSTINWNVKKLIKAKIIEVKNKEYSLTISETEILKLLISYKESFLDSLVNKTIEMWEVS